MKPRRFRIDYTEDSMVGRVGYKVFAKRRFLPFWYEVSYTLKGREGWNTFDTLIQARDFIQKCIKYDLGKSYTKTVEYYPDPKKTVRQRSPHSSDKEENA